MSINFIITMYLNSHLYLLIITFLKKLMLSEIKICYMLNFSYVLQHEIKITIITILILKNTLVNNIVEILSEKKNKQNALTYNAQL